MASDAQLSRLTDDVGRLVETMRVFADELRYACDAAACQSAADRIVSFIPVLRDRLGDVLLDPTAARLDALATAVESGWRLVAAASEWSYAGPGTVQEWTDNVLQLLADMADSAADLADPGEWPAWVWALLGLGALGAGAAVVIALRR